MSNEFYSVSEQELRALEARVEELIRAGCRDEDLERAVSQLPYIEKRR